MDKSKAIKKDKKKKKDKKHKKKHKKDYSKIEKLKSFRPIRDKSQVDDDGQVDLSGLEQEEEKEMLKEERLENPEIKSEMTKRLLNIQVERPKILSVKNFESFLNQHRLYYIDKTMWIKEVFNNKQRIQIYTRPRYMGKSLNLSMLQKFLNIEETNFELFSKTQIKSNNNLEFFLEHLNKYPVIMINFPRTMKKCKTFEAIQQEIRIYYQNDLVNNYKSIDDELNIQDLEPKKIMEEIIKHLFNKHKQKVWILIDNYDFPFQFGLLNQVEGNLIEPYSQILPKEWLYNEQIAKIIIMGQYQIDLPGTCLENFDTGLVSFLNDSYSQYFGFSKADVDCLFKERYRMEEKPYKNGLRFYMGFYYTYLELACPASIIGYLVDISTNRYKYPQIYQFGEIKQLQKILRISGLDEKGALNLIIDIFENNLQIDFYSRLKIDQIKNNKFMFNNFLVQSGFLTQKPESDKIKLSNLEATTMFQKLYIKLLNLFTISSQKILQYFRRGDFKNTCKNSNLDFYESKLNLVETRPEAYKHLTYSLFLADNLGYVKALPHKIEDKDVVIIIDEETGRAWITAVIFVRVKAQMRRQNLYILDKMKNMKYKSDEYQGVKRSYIVAFAYFGKENLIYCIEKKDFQIADKKHTTANDVFLKL